MINIINSTFFLDKFKTKFINNCFNINIITSNIIKYKILKFFLKDIFLDNLYYLLSNDLTYMQSNDSVEINKNCFQMR